MAEQATTTTKSKPEMAKKKQWRSLNLEIPLDGASATFEDNVLTVKGEKGEVSKRLRYPRVTIKVDGGNIVISTDHLSQREKKIMFTYQAHAKNLIKGVTEGFQYKLAIVYAKFPMTVEMNGQTFTVKNLLGERVPRTVEVPEDVKVEVKGKDIEVSGIDKEKTGQVAASIEQLTRINHFDRRVIQDGIFITEKPHRRYSE